MNILSIPEAIIDIEIFYLCLFNFRDTTESNKRFMNRYQYIVSSDNQRDRCFVNGQSKNNNITTSRKQTMVIWIRTVIRVMYCNRECTRTFGNDVVSDARDASGRSPTNVTTHDDLLRLDDVQWTSPVTASTRASLRQKPNNVFRWIIVDRPVMVSLRVNCV